MPSNMNQPFPEVGDEYEDTSDGTTVTVTSIDVWTREIGFTRRHFSLVSFNFEVLPEADFITAINGGFFKKTGKYSDKSSEDKDCTYAHKWDTYVGFSWTYKFCSRCGEKKK